MYNFLDLVWDALTLGWFKDFKKFLAERKNAKESHEAGRFL
jgi:hypothetical protein